MKAVARTTRTSPGLRDVTADPASTSAPTNLRSVPAVGRARGDFCEEVPSAVGKLPGQREREFDKPVFHDIVLLDAKLLHPLANR
jgi:hypothetical protein